MGLAADATKAETVISTAAGDVKGVIQLAELTYKQAREPFLIGAAAGVVACLAVLLFLHLIGKVL
jgi:hypothetical protein